MSEPLTFESVVEDFTAIALEQKLPAFKNKSEESIREFLTSYADQCRFTDNSVYTLKPQIFMSETYELLSRSDFPWVAAARQRFRARTTPFTAKDQLFFDAIILFMLRFQADPSIIEQGLTEPVNYFVKKDNRNIAPTVGPFQRVPSTFFGKELSIWEIEFPEETDMVLVYTNEGFLRMIFRREQGAIVNY